MVDAADVVVFSFGFGRGFPRILITFVAVITIKNREMKNRFFSILQCAGIVLCVALCCASCGNLGKTADEKAAQGDKAFVLNPRYASIDSLADLMIGDLYKSHLVEDVVSQYEDQTSAMRSYWALNYNDENLELDQLANNVAFDMMTLADKLSASPVTPDMMRGAEIGAAVSRYFTAKEYCKKNSKDESYQNEMSSWLTLEEELVKYFGDLAMLANWGGSIARLNACATMADVLELRNKDYSQFHSGGEFAECEMPISEARAELARQMADASSLDGDEMDDDPHYQETLDDMKKRGENVLQLLDKWLETRAAISESQKIPEAHTAHVIEALTQQIQMMIEG